MCRYTDTVYKKQESLFDGNDLCKNSFVLQSFFDKLFEKCSNYEMFKQELLGCNDLTEIEVLLRCFSYILQGFS